jgi:ATP/maltotriose-dependent transcriptional regulator MalT
LLAGVPKGSPEAILLTGKTAMLYAAQGRFDEARASVGRALATLEEFGRRLETLLFDRLAAIETWAGDLHAAEEALRRGLRIAEEVGQRYATAGLSASLSRVLYEQGRYEGALRATEASEELGAGRPGYGELLWRAIRAMVLARNGEFGAAEKLAREAVAGVGPESPALAGEMHMYLAEVLRLAGRSEEARAALEEAVRQFERKEHVVLASRARAALDELKREER